MRRRFGAVVRTRVMKASVSRTAEVRSGVRVCLASLAEVVTCSLQT